MSKARNITKLNPDVSGQLPTGNIADLAVTLSKIAGNSIDYTKLSSSSPTSFSGNFTVNASAVTTINTNVVNTTAPKSGLFICGLHGLHELTAVATSASYWHLEISGSRVVQYGGHRGTGAVGASVNYDHWRQFGWTYCSNITAGQTIVVQNAVDNAGSWSINNWQFWYIII
jgi:hypothetical protein